MNTENSDQIVARFRERPLPGTRRKAEWSHVVSGKPEEVFPLLCPSREADWIPGWTAELIYSDTGYAEQDCVFRTEMAGGIGPGVWVFTRHEEPVLVEIARFTPHVLARIRATLEEEDSPMASRTIVRWEYVLTALTDAGREMVDGMDSEFDHKAKSVGLALDHYLMTGEMIRAG